MKEFLLALLLLPLPAYAAAPCGDFARPAAELAALVAEKPAGLEKVFDKSLFAYISAEKLALTLYELRRDNGAVTQRVFVSSDNACSAHFLFETDRGYRVPVAMTLNPDTGRLSGVFFGVPYRKDLTLEAVRRELAALPGRASLLALRLGEKPEALEALNENEPFASASAFKLYVLGALLEAGTPWDKVYRLRAEDRSLPSGKLRGWPEGSPLTMHTLAALMISESDNTATDALISALGRRRLESSLPALGHAKPHLLRPFLRTSEMFRLKADGERAVKYLNLPAEERYGFLDDLRAAPLTSEGLRHTPFVIDRLEWLISPADLCRVMDYFLRKDSRQALEILALNPGLNLPPGKFLYAGYKGGGEPGVLAMAWLLKAADSRWYCLAAAWNDEQRNLEEKKFFGIMQGALNALGDRK
ncbi:MAG: serine hydrolase [Elusimicrobiales bacterium]|nr:serine hydrolase [Elusimicrobiales bacterium]